MEQEYWKDIAGFGGMYRISSFGRVMSEYGCGCRQMKTQMNNYGQKVVMLFDSIHGKAQTKMIGRMVAEHFVPNPEHHRFIRFLDGNPLNCHASNIIWASRTVLQEEQYRNSRKGIHQYTRDGKYLKTFPTMREAVREVTGRKSSSAQLSRACHNGMTAYGFLWRFSAEFPAGEDIRPVPECRVLQAKQRGEDEK